MIQAGFIEIENGTLSYSLYFQDDGLIEYEIDFPTKELASDEDREGFYWLVGNFGRCEPQGFCTWNDLSKDMQVSIEAKVVSEKDKLLLFRAKMTAKSVIADGQLIFSFSKTDWQEKH